MKTNTIIKWENQRCQSDLFHLKNRWLIGRAIVNYFNEDREKLAITIMFILFPVVLNSYHFTPDFYIPYYESFHTFVFTLSESLGHLMLAIAVYFAYNKKDTFMQLLPLGSILFIIYQLTAKLISVSTPGWIELLSISIGTVFLIYFLIVVKNRVISERNHKINHGFKQHICRIKGLAGITMNDKDLQIALMGTEVNKLDESMDEYFELTKTEEVE